MAKLVRYIYAAVLALVFALMLNEASAVPDKGEKSQPDEDPGQPGVSCLTLYDFFHWRILLM